ncbi:MAG: hypothetical protein FJY29_01230 [Betaproteobacteria bacterium]|nr:hypothetical protein [Betaproteobacteria bacterium]
MPVLFVPPTQVIPFDAERLVEQRKAMDEFRAQAVALWQTKPQDEIKTGGFRRSRSYEWSEPFDAILQTFYIYPTGLAQRTGEVAQVAALFKKDSCQLLGSAVVWGTEWVKALPSGEAQNELNRLKQASARKFENAKSPIRLSTAGYGYWDTTLAWISEAYVGEKLAGEGLIVHSDLVGVVCAKESKGALPGATASEPLLKRGHRQVRIVLRGTKPKQPERWPMVEGKVSVLALPLNTSISALKPVELKQEPFAPKNLAAGVLTQVQPALHVLNEKEIKVTQRQGRFATVERGLAYGLRIGMHLLGPDGAKLHVIRFDNRNGSADAAILLIRKESKEKPLAEGAILQVDSTQYPTK